MNELNKSNWKAQRPTTEQILTSKITAKATIKTPGKPGVTIIAAFQLSYEYAFWFSFTAKTARTPRKKWQRCATYLVRLRNEPATLDDMIGLVCRPEQDTKITKRYPCGKRNFADQLDMTANPLKYIVRRDSLIHDNFIVNRRTEAGRQGKQAWGILMDMAPVKS